MELTLLPIASRSSSLRTDTGTIATRDESRTSPRVVEVGAQGPGAQAEHHVVDGAPRGRLHGLHRRQVQRRERVAAAGRERGVERRAGRREGGRRQHGGVRRLAPGGGCRGRRSPCGPWPGPPAPAGGPAIRPRKPSSSRSVGSRSGSHSVSGTCSAISGDRSSSAMSSSLPTAPSMAAWWTLVSRPTLSSAQALDQPDLPEGAGAVEGQGHQPADQVGELLSCRRGRGSPCGGRGCGCRSPGPRSTAGGAGRTARWPAAGGTAGARCRRPA